MKKYSVIEIAVIFKGCKDIVDIMEACKIFMFLRQRCGEDYRREVFEMATARIKILGL
jgi:hypothetical protein